MVKRYDFEGIPEGMGECNGVEAVEGNNGDYVTYDDYEELADSFEECKKELEDLKDKITSVYMSYD